MQTSLYGKFFHKYVFIRYITTANTIPKKVSGYPRCDKARSNLHCDGKTN